MTETLTATLTLHGRPTTTRRRRSAAARCRCSARPGCSPGARRRPARRSSGAAARAAPRSAPGSRWSTWPPRPVGAEVEVTASAAYVDGRLHRFTVAARHPATGSWSAPARSPGWSSTPSGSCRGSAERPAGLRGTPRPPSTGDGQARRAREPTSKSASDQALGRLPWFAAFLRRERRLRPVLPMVSSRIECCAPVSQTARARRESEAQPSVIRTWTRADLHHHALPQLAGRGLGAGAGHDGLDGALEVVLLQARAALVEVQPDRRAVGLVELVVEEVDDALEVVGAVLAAVLAGSRLGLPCVRPAAGRWLARSRTACRAAGAGRGAAATSRSRWGSP